ncbi:MAG: ABC transporter substrate-binding protein [Treponema sp.]|nr:MAG: ABC transporter substrate-binding protein [Treponema sp.]
MKSFLKIVGVVVAVGVLFLSCNGGSGDAGSAQSEGNKEIPVAKHGMYADKVIYSVSMDQSVALKDVIEGKTDIMFTSVPYDLIEGLSDEDRDKIDVYSVPSGSLALWLNPIPNKAPYSFTTTKGEEVFNPFAINEVRYAMNWLVNRKQIVDEVLKGAGDPMFTMITPGLPGTYKYNLLAAKLGMTATGDEEKAIKMIDEAMKKAAELPENKGKLVKNGQFWEYNGKPASIKFYIRVDDPAARLVIGRQISDKLEKAGLKVERLEWDRSKVMKAVYGANPQDFICSMYTEGWGAGGTASYFDVNLSQMGAPYYGYMPGGANPDFWCYENEEIDRLGMQGSYGQHLTTDAYWKANLRMNELIMKDAVRIWLSSQKDSYVANKANMEGRVVYGLGDGMNEFSIRTANVKPNDAGEKILRIGQFSARGTLFMSTWDPIGTQGFSDVYSMSIVGAISDNAVGTSPVSGQPFGLSVGYQNPSQITCEPKLVKNAEGIEVMGGDVAVPADAVKYNSATKTWEKVGEGVTSAVSVKSKITKGYCWHNGEPVTIADIRYADAFQVEWATQDGEDDPYYDSPFASQMSSSIANDMGKVWNSDGSVVAYSNYFFAPDSNHTASGSAINPKAANPGRPTVFPWEIYEAFAEMCVNGSASGTEYNIVQGDDNQIDVIKQTCVADVKAKLEEFIANKHIPVSLKGIVTEKEAVKRYEASLKFIETYGHAYISNGPGFIAKIDTVANSIIIDAFDKYPRKANEFVKQFRTDLTNIDYVKAPSNAKAGQDAQFEMTVSKVSYPSIDAVPAKGATVKLRLQHPDGSETVYEAEDKGEGKYVGTIPGSDTGKLSGGASYTVVIVSAFGDEAPSVATSSLVLP